MLRNRNSEALPLCDPSLRFFFLPLRISLYSHSVRRVLMFHSRYAAEQSHCCLWTFLTQRLGLMTRRDGHMGRHEGVICQGSELLNSALMNSSAFVWHSSAHVCCDSQRASFCWCHASPTPKSFYSSWDTDNICLQNKKNVPEKARRHSTFLSFSPSCFCLFSPSFSLVWNGQDFSFLRRLQLSPELPGGINNKKNYKIRTDEMHMNGINIIARLICHQRGTHCDLFDWGVSKSL